MTEQVALSGDGTRMLVSSDRSGNPDLWSLPVAGGDMQQVTTDPMPDWAPAWSPDGRTAAFYSARTGNREIWLQPLAGGPARQLTTGQAQNVYPAWSADGSRLAFERDGQICIALVADGAERCLDRPPSGAYFPAWSPDGQWLAVQIGGVDSALARVPAAGGPIERLKERVGVTRPAWSADGRWIYSVVLHEGTRNVWGVTPDGRVQRQFTDLSGRSGTVESVGFSTDDRFFYLTLREDTGDIWTADLVSPR